MREKHRHDNVRRGAFCALVVLVAIGISPVAAQEYCVACKDPDTFYRCVIDDARPGNTASLPMLCITTMARDGAHSSCAVRRDVGVIDCNGPVKHISLPADGTTAPLQPPAATAATPAPTAAPPQGDPKTVEEMLRRAKEKNDRAWKKTNEQMKSNNDQIGGFFKKTWTCVSSLFSKCSD